LEFANSIEIGRKLLEYAWMHLLTFSQFLIQLRRLPVR
jgi:hypothetical protein